ncbi:immunogenic protein [Pochonia chlamydosporia 170]|uniref:Immunogenic protein n=1 Tax=Pochonia chlamydosporia 170 TaxID=1380566 RepID=A0A179FMY7_METCM|nr:immunogenic protein [Pochonia chlamydosporia 170]OAQ66934.1 immunogenic protein [Pochonia chlamydosporia 170]
MAEEQKPVVELPKEETAPAPAVEAAEPAPALAVEDKTAEETTAAEETEAKTEDKPAEEVKPVEEGHLGHKAQGASFPKNLIPSKEFFFFGSDAFEPTALAAYLKGEKNTEHAHHNISWASHTGNGLLFVGDKKAPTSVINLADATEPENDGTNKFHFTHKGNKHSFKAATTAERDGWVAQLKTKIAEAKELAASVTESEAYKNALESFKPKPVVKEEKPVEEAKPEEATKTEETPAAEGEAAAAATEDKPVEEPKRRSASRKRASIFGFGKKESTKEKKEEAKTEETVAPEVVEPAAEAEAPKAEEETPAVESEAAAAAEDKPSEEEKPAESPKEKPAASKRNSFFGGVFGKKEKKVTEAKPAEEADKEEGETTTDAAAPVIPPVESTTPLADEVNAAADNAEATATNGAETAKKDVKEKRKSSLPFNFGKREKSPAPAEGEEKVEKSVQSRFSKLRATIKGKSGAKAEKPAEDAVKEEATAADAAATEEPVTAVEEPVKAAETEAENKPENVASATPAVTAAA